MAGHNLMQSDGLCDERTMPRGDLTDAMLRLKNIIVDQVISTENTSPALYH